MEGAETWLTAVKLVGGALAALLIGLAGLVTGRKTGGQATVDGEVVAASFTEKAQLDRLILTLATVNETMGDLASLLRAEAQHRHDEAVVREALRARGIRE